MASAPVVQNLQDLVTKYTAASQPQFDQLDQEVAGNQQSGDAQIAGVNAAKTNAFGGITQEASNRGQYFSGFSPDQEAKYTGATYLPALAKVQAAIAGVRNTLLGKKADLSTAANTNAIGEQRTQQSSLDSWNTEQEKEAQAAQAAEAERQFTAAENAKSRAASASSAAASAASKQPSASDLRGQAVGGVTNFFNGLTGSDNRVSPTTYAQAKANWTDAGYAGGEFDNLFSAYRNPNNKFYKLG